MSESRPTKIYAYANIYARYEMGESFTRYLILAPLLHAHESVIEKG
jgi:hypothetical protein